MVAVLPGEGRTVRGLAFSPDGSQLAVGSSEGTRIWSTIDWTAGTFLSNTRDPRVAGLAWSADGLRLGSSSGMKLDLFELPSGRPLVSERWRGNARDPEADLEFLPDGTLLAGGSVGGLVRLHQDGTLDEVRRWGVTSVAVEKSGDRVVLGTPVGCFVGSLEKEEDWVLSRWQSGKEMPACRAAVGGDDLFAYMEGRSLIRLRSLRDSGSRQFSVSEGNVASVALSPSGARLAAATSTGAVHVWDVETGARRDGPWALRTGKGVGLSVSSTGRWLAVSTTVRQKRGGHSWVHLWNLATGRLESVVEGSARMVSFGPDDLLVTWASGELLFIDPATGETHHTVPMEVRPGSLSFSSDRSTMAATPKQIPTTWRTDTWEVAVEMPRPPSRGGYWALGPVAVSPTGRLAIPGGAWGVTEELPRVSTHVVAPGEEGMTALYQGASVQVAAWSPDGRVLATADRAGQVVTWDADTSEVLHVRQGGAGEAEALAFSPDGALLASATRWERGIRLWRADSSEQVGEIVTPGGTAALAFVAQTGALVWLGEDGGVRVVSIEDRNRPVLLATLLADASGDVWAAVGAGGFETSEGAEDLVSVSDGRHAVRASTRPELRGPPLARWEVGESAQE